MLQTMCRPPMEFTPEGAHEFLEKVQKIAWCPYSSRNLSGVDQLQRAYLLSIRRAILPWRFLYHNSSTCVAEPYHPDRVARQLKLDQRIPFNPLKSLWTESDVGVAYTYWSHLFLPIQEGIDHPLNSTYEGKFDVAWTRWWKKFLQPFTLILGDLKSGSLYGGISYINRKKAFKKKKKGFMVPRKLSESDFVIIKEVPADRQEEYIAVIDAKEKEQEDHWNTILTTFLSDDEPSMPSRRKRKDKGVVIGSSSNPLLPTDGVNLSIANPKEPCTNEVISSDEEARPTSKRKLDFANDDNTSSPIKVNGPLYVHGDFNCTNLDNILRGDVDHGLDDFHMLNVDDYESAVDVDFRISSPRIASDMFPSTDISSHLSSPIHGIEDAPVSSEEASAHIAMLSVGVPFVTGVFMQAIDAALKPALEGLNNTTVADPDRCEILKAVALYLPANDDIARVAAIRSALNELIFMSSQMQESHKEIKSHSHKKDEAFAVADKECMLLEEILKETDDKLVSMEEQYAEERKHAETLKAQLEKVNTKMHQIKEGVEKLKLTRSSKQGQAKKLRDSLSEINAKANQELEDLKQKISTMGNEVESILERMKNLPAAP
ncbi:unnamed protein product [Alopecurus aequalis]